MAHQAHNLPWQTLASNFRFSIYGNRHENKTNLYPRYRKDQGKKLRYFVKAFIRSLDEFSTCERAKYASEYTALEPEDVVISPATARRIRPMLLKAQAANWCYGWCSCEHDIIPLSPEHVRMSHWIGLVMYKYRPWTLQVCNDGSELIKTLILYNELDTLFKVAAHPITKDDTYARNSGPADWWSFPYDSSRDCGWRELMRCALMAYICLNVFYAKPETWDPRFKSKQTLKEDMDYRSTSAYQKMLVRCTGWRDSDTHNYPHREFFGVPRSKYFSSGPGWDYWFYYGLMPVSKLFRSWRPQNTKPYAPLLRDVHTVDQYLRQKGLPPELSTEVLKLADYTMKRRLVVPDDPLHPDNAVELRKYLNYCWQLLIRTDLVARALGRRIQWEEEITLCIMDLWGDSRRMVTYNYERVLIEGWHYLSCQGSMFV